MQIRLLPAEGQKGDESVFRRGTQAEESSLGASRQSTVQSSGALAAAGNWQHVCFIGGVNVAVDTEEGGGALRDEANELHQHRDLSAPAAANRWAALELRCRDAPLLSSTLSAATPTV